MRLFGRSLGYLPALQSSRTCQAAQRVPSRHMNPEPTSASASSPARLVDPTRGPKISFVSLGCPKALVDSERIIGRLRAEGYELTKAHQDAAAVIFNTCGFLDSAKPRSTWRRPKTAKSSSPAAWVRSGKGFWKNLRTVVGSPARRILTPSYGSVHEAAAPPHDPFLDLLPPKAASSRRATAPSALYQSYAAITQAQEFCAQ
jgi:ribosomal protein S12 methylthiotransferase